MRQVDGGVFLNEPNIGLIAEALRSIFNEGIAKECGVTLTGVKVVHKNTREPRNATKPGSKSARPNKKRRPRPPCNRKEIKIYALRRDESLPTAV